MTEIKKAGKNVRRRVSKRDWLETGLKLLWLGGIEAVRIERLAAELNVNKSGFYYHFRDRMDLQSAMLEHWLELDDVPFIEVQKHAGIGPAEALRIVSEVVDHSNLSRYDSAIRQWARLDPRVRRVWRQQMNKRIEFIRTLFSALGLSGVELEARTMTFVGYEAAERNILSDLSAEERDKLRDHRLRMLLRPID